jgi:diguanylate cyclase (GGDEF)-like protein
MRLTRLFMFTTGLLLTLVVVMLVRSTMQDVRIVRSAEQGLTAMESAYRVMKFAEKASAERGPTIMLLNNSMASDSSKMERLISARIATDEALQSALVGLEAGLVGKSQEASKLALVQIQKSRDQLVAARIEVERVAALPFNERTKPELRLTRKPIDQMFSVIDTVFEGLTGLSAEAERIYPDLSLQLVGARYAAELREYAGRLGSQFTVPLATQKALSVEERRDIPEFVGRIQQLRKLVEVRARVALLDPRLDAAIAEMNKRYFGVDLPFIAGLTELGMNGQPYGLDSVQFIERYVPEMTSIVQLRDTMFEVAKEQATLKIAQAKRRTQLNLMIGCAILLTEIGVFLLIQRRVIKPLLITTNQMLRLMNGNLELSVEKTSRTDEIGEMQNAVAALKEMTEKRIALEAEREQLIAHLQVASEVDFLTSLLNRRALMQRGEQLLAQAKRHHWSVAVVLFDIDHFKLVNDAYGHAVGDQVLIQVAAIAQSECRQADLLARYGGEEFILLAFDCEEAQAIQLAERVRAKMANYKFGSGPDTFELTASFGVAHAQSFEVEHLEILIKGADRALYKAKSQGRNCVVESDALFFVDGHVDALQLGLPLVGNAATAVTTALTTITTT